MTYTYKLLPDDAKTGAKSTIILRKEDNVYIPMSQDNTDYQEYLAWVAEGNTPEAADQTVKKLTNRT